MDWEAMQPPKIVESNSSIEDHLQDIYWSSEDMIASDFMGGGDPLRYVSKPPPFHWNDSDSSSSSEKLRV